MRHARPDDLEAFHGLEFLHGDCNRYNFVIRPDDEVFLVDFECSEACVDPARFEEVASLERTLAKVTGRDGGIRLNIRYDEKDSDGELVG